MERIRCQQTAGNYWSSCNMQTDGLHWSYTRECHSTECFKQNLQYVLVSKLEKILWWMWEEQQRIKTLNHIGHNIDRSIVSHREATCTHTMVSLPCSRSSVEIITKTALFSKLNDASHIPTVIVHRSQFDHIPHWVQVMRWSKIQFWSE